MERNILVDLLIITALLGLVIAFISYMGWEFSHIRHHGRRIIATITEISYGVGNSDKQFSHNHQNVTAKWADPATGQAYTFWQLAAEVKPFYKIGNLVPIIIDPKHPTFYEMQI